MRSDINQPSRRVCSVVAAGARAGVRFVDRVLVCRLDVAPAPFTAAPPFAICSETAVMASEPKTSQRQLSNIQTLNRQSMFGLLQHCRRGARRPAPPHTTHTTNTRANEMRNDEPTTTHVHTTTHERRARRSKPECKATITSSVPACPRTPRCFTTIHNDGIHFKQSFKFQPDKSTRVQHGRSEDESKRASPKSSTFMARCCRVSSATRCWYCVRHSPEKQQVSVTERQTVQRPHMSSLRAGHRDRLHGQ